MSVFYNSLDFTLSLRKELLSRGKCSQRTTCTKEGPCTMSFITQASYVLVLYWNNSLFFKDTEIKTLLLSHRLAIF